MDIVKKIFDDCRFKEGDDVKNCIVVEDLIKKVIFNLNRLQNHQAEIEKKIDETLDDFKIFSNNKWTNEHERKELLYLLGVGINKIKPTSFSKLFSNEKIAS